MARIKYPIQSKSGETCQCLGGCDKPRVLIDPYTEVNLCRDHWIESEERCAKIKTDVDKSRSQFYLKG